MENKKASVEIGVSLSSSLMNASLTMLTIIMALFVFIIEKRVTNIIFYIFFSLSFLCFVISIFHSGKGIDKARKALFSNNYSLNKTKKHYNYQAIFCFLGILLFIISIFLTKEDKTEQNRFEKLNSNLEDLIKQNNNSQSKLETLQQENYYIKLKIIELENRMNSSQTQTLPAPQSPPILHK
ncbi:hypothetical protein CMT69_07890 [Elizabethkingia anophelis]|uniref:hypothetical protein n=1 Tax=Elizabethkingia anophelis TaxID=1117645 RepID=UPI000DD729BC|nr:hypothetical protein [Elizabethkingia anophelis]MCT3641372.1 hypothetical protein [Elizabethkingia anophelis]MDV3944847.1 hypothetical protein [Elizabethkingia anophelis]RBA44004.1 hypothetical protein DSC46_14610 [Elizabethkingia anophelis]